MMQYIDSLIRLKPKYRKGKLSFLVSVVLFCALALSGCFTPAPMLGVVATVNGTPIHFDELEVRRASLFPLGLEAFTNAPRETLLAQYGYALAELVQEQLIVQYMAQKKLTLPAGLVEAREGQIRADYPAGAFEELLLEEGISYATWKRALETQLVVEHFLATVIRPMLSITPDEVNAYYQANKSEFMLPEQWHYMQISGTGKTEVNSAVQAFLQTNNATQVQKMHPVVIRDIRMGKDRVPEAVTQELAGMAEGKATPVKKNGDAFRSYVLLEKTEERALSPADIYGRVEQVLVESKQRTVLDNWLAGRIAKSSILLHPVLAEGLGASLVQKTGVPSPAAMPQGTELGAPLNGASKEQDEFIEKNVDGTGDSTQE